MSFSDSAGTDTATPGRLMPLLLLTGPPTSTSVRTSVPSSTPVTRRRILPSSISSVSPTETSPGSPLYVVPQIVSSPSTSRTVMVHACPRRRCHLEPSSVGLNVSRRILGPCRSARMPTLLPLESDAARTRR